LKKLIVGLCFLAVTINAFAQQQIPLKSFVQLPDVEKVEISPSGNKVAMLKRVMSNGERVLVVEVLDLKSGKKSYPVVRRKHEFDVHQIIWANDNIVLLKIDYFKQRKIENAGWNPKITERRLMVLNLKENTLKNILAGKTMNRFQELGWEPQFQDYIVDMLPSEPNHILHAIDWDTRVAPQVFKVNLKTLDRKTVSRGKKYWDDFLTDRQSNLRVAVYKETVSGGFIDTRTLYEINVKDLKTGDWNVVWKFEAGAENQLWPLGFLPDPNMLLIKALHQGRFAVFKVDLREPYKRELFYSSETSNVGGKLFYSNKTDMPVGYHSVVGIHFWDEDFLAFNRGIDKALPNTTNYLKVFTEDENQYLIYTNSDKDSGTYYLGSRKQKSLNPIAFAYQDLDPALMRPNTRHLVTARDGKKIEVFVTLPIGYEDLPLATIIYASQGRGRAAVGGFDYRAQLWANRGYVVVQVNFRSGTGGLYKFMNGDVTKWAAPLYNDLADVSNWSVNIGYTDKNKTCLFAENYAGYIALMAAAKIEYPFKCVVTIGAMTDINNHLFNREGFVSHEQLRANLSDDASIQKAYSPITFADNFSPSVLLIHGENDSSIRAIQSQDMHKALKSNNKNSKHIEISDEDSSFSTDESRLKVFNAIEDFFAEHLN
jgi:dipeptidyl aminopeptidase/acylaminoacyl peptidase